MSQWDRKKRRGSKAHDADSELQNFIRPLLEPRMGSTEAEDDVTLHLREAVPMRVTGRDVVARATTKNSSPFSPLASYGAHSSDNTLVTVAYPPGSDASQLPSYHVEPIKTEINHAQFKDCQICADSFEPITGSATMAFGEPITSSATISLGEPIQSGGAPITGGAMHLGTPITHDVEKGVSNSFSAKIDFGTPISAVYAPITSAGFAPIC